MKLISIFEQRSKGIFVMDQKLGRNLVEEEEAMKELVTI